MFSDDTKLKDLSSGNNYSTEYSFSSGYEYSNQADTIIAAVLQLHQSDESLWSFRKYKALFGASVKASYNSKENVIRLKTTARAPLEKTAAYLLGPPYGVRNTIDMSVMKPDIIENVGTNGAVFHNISESSCFNLIAPREFVGLTDLRKPSTNVMVFAMKTVEHRSFPVKDGLHRAELALIGLYLEEVDGSTLVEEYLGHMDIKGRIGTIGSHSRAQRPTDKMVRLVKAIPGLPDACVHYKPPL